MYVEVDLRCTPPTTSLRDPSDFSSFKVVVVDPSDTFISQQVLRDLAGPLASDPTWQAGFEKMVAYAADHAWTNDGGDIQAHIEHEARR
jgi:hypothetical protein